MSHFIYSKQATTSILYWKRTNMFYCYYEDEIKNNKSKYFVTSIVYKKDVYRKPLKDTLKNIKLIADKIYLTPQDLDLYRDLQRKITSIAIFRATYSAQFPEKHKKITYKNKYWHKYIHLSTTNETKQSEKNKTLFLAYFLDTKEKIEKILNLKLCFTSYDQTYLIPEHNTVKVICNNKLDITENKNKNSSYVYRNYIKYRLSELYQEFENKFYSTELMYEVMNEEGATVKIPKPLLGKLTHTCPHCNRKYTKTNIFRYNKKNDSQICKKCYDEFENYKEPLKNINNIYSNYHENRSNWKFIICKRRNENSIPIGMELELELKFDINGTPANTKNARLLELHKTFGRKNVIFERDGSLNSGGVEIITNPMTSEYAKNFWREPAKLLEKISLGIHSGISEVTVNSPTQFWGIHLTTHIKHWNPLALIKTINFINYKENKFLMWKIAQRKTLYGEGKIADYSEKTLSKKGNYDPSPYITTKKPYYILTDRSNKQRVYSYARTTSINLTKQDFVEMRFFQATSDYLEIIKNYEFLRSVHEFFHTCNTNLITKSDEYLKWLIANENNKKKYQNLIQYLKQDSFPLRESDSVVIEKHYYLL